MINIFKIPKINYDDIHNQSMFILSYRIISFSTLGFIAISLANYGNDSSFFWLSTSVSISSFLAFVYLRKFGKHTMIMKFFVILASILIQFSIYNLLTPDRLIDMIWIFAIIAYSFYVLGLFWGVLILTINFSGILLCQFIIGKSDFFYNKKLTTLDHLNYFVLIIIGGFTISYLLVLFYKTNRITYLKYKLANQKLRENNEVMKAQNKEKSVMLKEIHHRVKNNLQVIISLLRLQSRDIKDIEVVKQFNEATNRIIAMSLIHEKIYQTKNLSDIDISSYFKSLTNELIRSYSINIPIKTKISSNLNHITPDHMVPIALLLNELASNSIKHGFKGKKEGEICINMESTENSIIFEYCDNGKWSEQKNKNSFGLELISTLTEQLGGEYSRETSNGTKYKFTFPYKLEN